MDLPSVPHSTKPYEVCRSLPNACVGKEVCLHILQKQFKYLSFRPGQLEAILPALHGEDVFVRMGTGSGKTLCMYMPVLASHQKAMALVFSPLTGLMEQQVSVI